MKISRVELRAALIAAFVAVLVAAPLSNAAHDQLRVVVKKVTGKQGKRGPRGLRGPTGPQGPKGEPGAPAPGTGLYDAKLVLPGETVTVVAGGCGATPGSVADGDVQATAGSLSDLTLVREGLMDDGSQYFAVLTNPSDNHAVVKAHATCS